MLHAMNSPTPTPWWNRRGIPALVLLALTFLAYQPIWNAGFLWDDNVMLTENRFVQSPDGLSGIWFSTEQPDYFPMTSTVLWLEWRLWGTNASGYHLINVLLHAVAALLWWRVLLRLAIPGAWLAAALFALHPVNVESVAWITEIKNTLSMVFYAAALLAYLRFDEATFISSHERERVDARKPPVDRAQGNNAKIWYAAALGLFVLGLLSKTAVAPFPVVLLGIAFWRRGRIDRRDLWQSVPFFVAAAGLAVATIWFQHHRAIAGAFIRDDDFWTRLAAAGWAGWFYLSKALVPANLVFVYPRWEVIGTNPLAYVPLLLAVAVLAVCWRFRRTWGRACLFALGYFVALLLPVLGFIDISFMRHSLVADRWQYFALIGPVALGIAGLTLALRRFSGGEYLRFACGGILVLGFGALTWKRSQLFTDADTLWLATLAGNPACAVANNHVGATLFEKGQVDEAIVHYQKAIATLPRYELAHYHLGCALAGKGQPDEAMVHYRKALEIYPDFVDASFNLATTLLEQGRVDDSIAEFQRALAMRPHWAKIHNNLASALLQRGRVDDAVTHYQNAIALEPTHASARNNLGWIALQTGRWDEAIGYFQSAVQIKPDYVQARCNLADAFLRKGQARDAITEYQAVLNLQPKHPEALGQLAWLLATNSDASLRNGPRAVELARLAAETVGGEDASVLRVLAAAFAEARGFADATKYAERALTLASAQSNEPLAEALRSHLALYRSGQPVREIASR
jgi:tetratricopeptide (TPR) repeat protein